MVIEFERVGWVGVKKNLPEAHLVIAYPPQHKQIDLPMLFVRHVAVFGGLAILTSSQGENLRRQSTLRGQNTVNDVTEERILSSIRHKRVGRAEWRFFATPPS